MKQFFDISLRPYNTFGIDSKASRMVVVESREDLMELLESGLLCKERFVVLGGGSNVVFTGDFNGTVVLMRNREVRLLENGRVEAGAGMILDDLVRYCSRNGLHGMENLTAIPGTVGASAVQNVGAYGLEAKDVIECVEAYDISSSEQRIFTNAECDFGYRWSVFKGALAGKYIIVSVTYKLSREFSPTLCYQGLAKAMQETGLEHPTAEELIDLITDVRWAKLPKPGEVGSAGSFFKNPIVSREQHESLKQRYPDLVSFPAGENYKLAAGWLIEKSGWKGRTLNHAGVWARQALVLVNADGLASGKDVVALADEVVQSVEQQFGVKLEKEAIIIE